MGHAILNRLIGLVNKTLKMSFFSRKLSFSQFKLGFGSMTPKKRTLLKEDINWLDILETCYISISHTQNNASLTKYQTQFQLSNQSVPMDKFKEYDDLHRH